MSDRTCSTEGCERPRRKRSLCNTHYTRWYRTRDDAAACAVDGCERPQYTKGYCSLHYQRWRKHGDPGSAELRRGRTDCQVDGCEAPHRRWGFCATHATRWRVHGDPDWVDKPGWVGDEIGYKGMHNRLYRLRGPATLHRCRHCSGQAAEWGYDHLDPNEQRGLNGEFECSYSLDPSHYVPLCVSCHRKFDRT